MSDAIEAHERLLMRGDLVDCSMLPQALDWWGAQDGMGGFRAAGRELFPAWEPGECCSAPHREERMPQFSITRNPRGEWYFKDVSNHTIGNLVSFVMLAGMTASEAMRWLMRRESTATAGDNPNVIRVTTPLFDDAPAETQTPQTETQTQPEQQPQPQSQPPVEKPEAMETIVSYHPEPINPINGHVVHNGVSHPANGASHHANSPASAPAPRVQDADYPAPLAGAAYHGIAGELVRLIEPHTEADPAALLFQFLAAFGNIIGRDAHMMADGARHGMNLFGVLVGQSSKGRKGTSWNQVASVLGRVDEEWKQDRVMGGLSSGEGLIWGVRDATVSSKPDGENPGEFLHTTLDAGVADKRLMILEGEFANALKVMGRDGNTLSSIIRAAWDTGEMRILTKNSPVKATGAHISIAGHITRDELRRLLSESDASNGFANRICWLAVRRSKCLPEGGRIDTVNFNDIIIRLKAAIDFARNPNPGGNGEIRRHDTTRDLWRAIYPILSAERPGLLGHVTGRAEAQVMRISAIYALLDGSAIIRPEHHYAAMALWSYSEQSARWIFGTATGDKNADKILAALRAAGGEGMTRSEISEKVFMRNISKTGFTEALATLQQAGMVDMEREMHGNAVCERWIARNG